eukprot:CAMPEP_0113623356 /NCGR_PEP_ID=MMETSP0017_2-20120614/12010_1 /TAXON_ID=2856 /ORGANISM="Cylindrotheca closterium" /LENGTH=523 /DNA_ID=CAMNT_0000533293 /DNA_START=2958 /DNA_END=4526 /DNA_ORIENTATION=- /assembly_acc=CAM_ASM_000147
MSMNSLYPLPPMRDPNMDFPIPPGVLPMPVALADGSSVDVSTREGAIAFMTGKGNLSFIVDQLRTASNRRRVNHQHLSKLNRVLELATLIVGPKVFRNIPESEIQSWLDLVIEQVKKATNNRKWDVSPFLTSCMAMLTQPVPVFLAFEESDFFPALVGFITAHKGNDGRTLPSAQNCFLITRLVSMSWFSSASQFDNPWTAEKAFKKLEASGILGQFLRCATVQQHPMLDRMRLSTYQMIEMLQSCPIILSRKFKRGEPCGDILQAILDGNDGASTPQPEVIQKLRDIARMVRTVDTTKYRAQIQVYFCEHCGKSDKFLELKFHQCAKCQFARYCSRECQVADWKRHKPVCNPFTKNTKKLTEAMHSSIQSFISEHHLDVGRKMAVVCKKTGLEIKDMIIELNFMPNQNGIIPAMQRPPIYRIAPRRDYVNGTVEPEWWAEWKKSPKNREIAIEDMKTTGPKVPSHKCGVMVHIGDYEFNPIWRLHPAVLTAATSFRFFIETGGSEALMDELMEELKESSYVW